ncbi:MAG: hypothetical protein QM692_09860 [Thermomicrobiales bacterium]
MISTSSEPIPSSATLAALHELEGMIREQYPEATFEIVSAPDPGWFWLMVTIDLEDADEVYAVVLDRIVDMQVDGLLVQVQPVRPLSRQLEDYRRRHPELEERVRESR